MINKWRVSRPVFGLIDEVAEKAGFYPVFPTPQAGGPDASAAPAKEKKAKKEPAAAPVSAGGLLGATPSVAK